jgi:hypothetical protein
MSRRKNLRGFLTTCPLEALFHHHFFSTTWSPPVGYSTAILSCTPSRIYIPLTTHCHTYRRLLETFPKTFTLKMAAIKIISETLKNFQRSLQLVLETGSYTFFSSCDFCGLFNDAISNWTSVVVVVVSGSTALCWALASSSVS